MLNQEFPAELTFITLTNIKKIQLIYVSYIYIVPFINILKKKNNTNNNHNKKFINDDSQKIASWEFGENNEFNKNYNFISFLY